MADDQDQEVLINSLLGGLEDFIKAPNAGIGTDQIRTRIQDAVREAVNASMPGTRFDVPDGSTSTEPQDMSTEGSESSSEPPPTTPRRAPSTPASATPPSPEEDWDALRHRQNRERDELQHRHKTEEDDLRFRHDQERNTAEERQGPDDRAPINDVDRDRDDDDRDDDDHPGKGRGRGRGRGPGRDKGRGRGRGRGRKKD